MVDHLFEHGVCREKSIWPANLNKNNSGRVSQPCLKNQPESPLHKPLMVFGKGRYNLALSVHAVVRCHIIH